MTEMITHKSNFDALRLADNCTYPLINLKCNTFYTDDGIRYKLTLASKIPVKGRNGERYYVPMLSHFNEIKEKAIARTIEYFQANCRNVQDYYITTEGKDVLAEDYEKAINYKDTKNEVIKKA